MTSEIRTAIDLSDILGIEIECPKCIATVLLPARNYREGVPGRCMNCSEPLVGAVAAEQFRTLIRAVAMLSVPNDGLQASVRILVKPISGK